MTRIRHGPCAAASELTCLTSRLTILFGLLCAGRNSVAQSLGTPRGIHTVTITGTSGMTTNTVQVKLVVK